MLTSLAPRRLVTAVIAVVAAAGALAGCSGSNLGFRPKASGPPVTLRVAVYGTSGYSQAGLYSQFEVLHPGAHVVEKNLGQEQGYWSQLQSKLASGTTGADLVAIPIADIGTAISKYAKKLVPLSTLGGEASGVNTFNDNYSPWLSQPGQKQGAYYALAAQTAPLALCYRPILLREAGLPSSPTQLARSWASWRGYLAYGKTFARRISHGPAFMDSGVSLYNAMVSQYAAQYYTPTGQPYPGNTLLKAAWTSAVQAVKQGLTAKLTPLTSAWDTGVQRLQFATTVCTPSMLSSIQAASGKKAAPGTWAVTKVPGGTGNWGGFYFAIPRTSTHQQDAFQLLQYLTSQQSGAPLAQVGGFPASTPAINAAAQVRSAYFSSALIGKIFGTAANRMPTVTTGPATATVAAAFDQALTSVVSGKSPAAAWQTAQRKAKAAYRSAKKH